VGGKKIDWESHVGERWGRLVIVKPVKDERGKTGYECRCDCGNTCIVKVYQHLIRHKKQSCGCLTREIRQGITHPKNVKDGKTNIDLIREHSKEWQEHCRLKNEYPRIYNIWHKIKQRVGLTDWNDNNHKRLYEERGIRLCEEWQNYDAFATWSLKHGYADNLTIDRIDNNGNYEPNNCRWVTQKENCRNKGNNHLVTIDGETHCVAEWIEIMGLTYGKVYSKVHQGMTVEQSLETFKHQQ